MSKPLRVLIVEDSENDALLVVEELKRGGYDPDSERVETREAMEKALSEKTWDIVISDYALPHFNAPEALKVLQKTGIEIPFIVVSGTIGEEVAIETLKLGAQDYLMKGNLARLCTTVERELKDAIEQKEHKRLAQEREARMYELEVFHASAMGREERILELKEEVEELKEQLRRMTEQGFGR